MGWESSFSIMRLVMGRQADTAHRCIFHINESKDSIANVHRGSPISQCLYIGSGGVVWVW